MSKISFLRKRLNIPPNQYLKISAVLLVVFGVCLAPSGFISYLVNEEAHSSEARFSRILYTIKKDCESDFEAILNTINDDPLDDLVRSKLPTAEEIFLSEWANDWFPKIEIAIVGSIIEEAGAEMVGDINLDNKGPIADLNISSHDFPSNLSLIQCKALWNRRNKYALTYALPYIWFNALEGNNQSKNLLKSNFDLTESEISLIFTWVETSINGWAKNISYLDVFDYINYAFLGLGLIIISIGVIIFRVEQKRIKGKIPVKTKKKKQTSIKESK